MSRGSGDDATTAPDLGAVVRWAPTTTGRRLLAWFASTGIRLVMLVLLVGLVIQEFDVATGSPGSTLLVYVVLSAIPALAIAIYIWYMDVSVRPSVGLVVGLFVLGGLSTGLAHLTIGLFGSYLITVIQPLALPTAVVFAAVFVLIAAPIEESVKLMLVYLYAFDSPQFSSVVSGALFGAIVGLGFATVENAVTIADTAQGSLLAGDEGLTTATVRALSGPGHVLYSAIAGYYLGLARFNTRYRTPLVLFGLGLAIGLHATFNVLISRRTLDVPGLLVETVGFSRIAALFTITITFNGLLLIYLIHKLSAYRNAKQGANTVTARPRKTEFDP